jgi:hypothetical protein
MHAYNFSEIKQNLNSVFEQAALEGGVQIKGEDGRIFMLTPVNEKKSPLDIQSVSLDLTADEIVDFIHESRR